MVQQRSIHHSLDRDPIFRALVSFYGITTADGLAGGTTLVCSALIGSNDFITGKVILLDSGLSSLEEASASLFVAGTGTITVNPAFTSQVLAGTAFYILNVAAGGGTLNLLKLARSTQSGDKIMAGAWTVIYAEAETYAWLFAGAEIDLSTMQAGDIVNIRIRTQNSAVGALGILDQVAYLDAQPATHPKIRIPSIANTFGVEIAMQQTAGALRTFPCEFFDAKR